MGWDSFTAEMRSQQAIEMRAMGVDYGFIAKELGYADRSGAWRAVNRGMKRGTTNQVNQMRWAVIHELTRIADSLQARNLVINQKTTDQLVRLVSTKIKLLHLD